jgi:hypothetical protein
MRGVTYLRIEILVTVATGSIQIELGEQKRLCGLVFSQKLLVEIYIRGGF